MSLEWTETDSSNVHSVAYHEPSKTLAVRFKSGGLYSYLEVDRETYSSMVHADSVGGYLNRVVKSLHAYTRWASEADLMDHLTASG